jgi:uncharacterized cupin superfamily protein
METVHADDVDPERQDRGDIAFERRQLGAATDSEDLGCSLHEVPPGKHTWPYHYHSANEEAIYVLDGEGHLRGPDDERVALDPGTYASFPAGPAGAHQIENTGEEPLRFLAVSTMVEPEALVYPDADAVGVMAGEAPGGDEDARDVSAYFHAADAVDFWDDVAQG